MSKYSLLINSKYYGWFVLAAAVVLFVLKIYGVISWVEAGFMLSLINLPVLIRVRREARAEREGRERDGEQ